MGLSDQEGRYRRSDRGKPVHEPHLTRHALEWEGFLVEVVLRPMRGRKSVTELHITPLDPGGPPQPLSSALLRRLPLGHMAEDALFIEAQGELHTMAHPIRRDGRFYAEVASRYLDLVNLRDSRPAETMAHAMEVSVRTVHAWLGRARKRGLLTSSGPGQAGGELTDKARDLLNQDHHEGD
jgi:hypothetical protein